MTERKSCRFARSALFYLVILSSCHLVSFETQAADVRKLDGQTVTGEVTSLDDKTVVLMTATGLVTIPTPDILQLDLIKPADLAPLGKDPYTDVELIDGSLLHCKSIALKGKQAEVQLLAGQSVSIPLAAISSYYQDAQDAKVRQDWQNILGKKGTRDLLAIKSGEGVLNALEGTLGDADDKGETIEFELTSGRKVKPSLVKIHGMVFVRKADAAQPPTLCNVTDSYRCLLAANKITLSDKGFTLVTVAGVKIEVPKTQLARLDYSRGKLTYLSDLEPIQVKETSTEDRIDHYRRDKNLDNGPLTLPRHALPFLKGLALHSYTELLYDIGGDYKKFEAVLGVDDLVGGDSNVRVTIEGDGRELFSAVVKRKDEPRPITVDIKGVKKLRIEVRSAELLDLGNHVDLADAKVSK